MTKSLNIWVLQTGEPVHTDSGTPRPMRAMNLCDALIARGHRVTLWTSCFYHQEKIHRCDRSESIPVSENFTIQFIHSPGYQRNIGAGRLVDHARLALGLRSRLKQQEVLQEAGNPDVAFIGYPPIEAAYVMSSWLDEKRVPCLLDVKDQWPVIFVNAFPRRLRPIGKLMFWPYFYLARKAMQKCTGITAMAGGFLDWAVTFCGRSRGGDDRVYPLTTPPYEVSDNELSMAQRWWDDCGVSDEVPNICFIGSLSSTFDFEPVRDAAKRFADSDIPVRFILAGTGSRAEEVMAMMSGLDNVVFPGWIDQPRIAALAGRSIASLAPYINSEDFQLSVPNKVIDALSLGLPVLSPLQGEVAELIDMHGIGMRYGCDTGKILHECITDLLGNDALRHTMSTRARTLYQSEFSFESIYGAMAAHLEQLAEQGA